MRSLILDDTVSVGGARHPTDPDADPVLHFTTGKLVVQLMASDVR